MALFPFIILSDKRFLENVTLINHERIHLRQQAELFVIPFYLWYGIEFLIRLMKFRDRKKAYRSISFEAEAYTEEDTPRYLEDRTPFSFTKYL